jgi:hypothetical protein
MSDMFPIHFRAHVLPRLHRLTTAEAFCVAHGAQSWAEAFDGVWNYARRYGAVYLPSDVLADLDDWLCATLLEEITRQEAELSSAVVGADGR